MSLTISLNEPPLSPNEPQLSPEDVTEVDSTLMEFRNAFAPEIIQKHFQRLYVDGTVGGRRLFWRPAKKPKTRLIWVLQHSGAV